MNAFPACRGRGKSILLFAGLLLTATLLRAQKIRIGIDMQGLSSTITYQAMGDEVIIMTGDSFPVPVGRLSTLEKVEMIPSEGKVMLMQDGKTLARQKQFTFLCNDPVPRFQLISTEKSEAPRLYPDQLDVSVRGKNLLLVNQVLLEPYVMGVVEAEAGIHKSLEFMKVQAVSARTYAMANRGKHAKEGFDLCDKTHCQVYKGISAQPTIIQQAVEATQGEVIVFGDSILVDAVFSANCGGCTANAGDVWMTDTPYLQSVSDFNYCEGFPNHEWHVMIPRGDFLASLGKYYKTEAVNFDVVNDGSGRVKRLELNNNPSLSISGEELRKLFKLKSSKFHFYESKNMMYLEGEGFGHGVGLCQDGAYYLSEMGLDYDEIIRHYYQGVKLMPLLELGGWWR